MRSTLGRCALAYGPQAPFTTAGRISTEGRIFAQKRGLSTEITVRTVCHDLRASTSDMDHTAVSGSSSGSGRLGWAGWGSVREEERVASSLLFAHPSPTVGRLPTVPPTDRDRHSSSLHTSSTLLCRRQAYSYSYHPISLLFALFAVLLLLLPNLLLLASRGAACIEYTCADEILVSFHFWYLYDHIPR